MNPICEKCKGAAITSLMIGALILHCPVDQKKDKCPYLPPEQHTHNEIYVPPNYRSSTVTVATTAGFINHDSVVEVGDDPERPGFKISILKF